MYRILLVEDDVELRVLLTHVLLSAQYAVDAAEGVGAALEFLRENRYDLVVADARLDDGTGIAVAQRAVELEARALIITGYAFELPKDELERFEFLLKPVRPGELLETIERLLQTTHR